MKFLPLYYREQMRNFFEKRGKSWHVSCVIEKEEDSFSVQCFSHLFEECKQDWFAVPFIVENVLKTLKREKPFISKCFFAQTMALAITMQPCCLLLQPLVQELGYISVDTIFQNNRQRKTYVTEK